MRLGVLQQVGTPEELYTRPVNVFVARFIGSPAMNLVPADRIDGLGFGPDRLAGFRPEHIEVADGRPPDAPRFDASVEVVEYLGDEQLVHLRFGETELLAKLPVEQHLATGQEQEFWIPREKLHVFDAATEHAVAA
jgi:multiple sugar transport system ATP-binding protein